MQIAQSFIDETNEKINGTAMTTPASGAPTDPTPSNIQGINTEGVEKKGKSPKPSAIDTMARADEEIKLGELGARPYLTPGHSKNPSVLESLAAAFGFVFKALSSSAIESNVQLIKDQALSNIMADRTLKSTTLKMKDEQKAAEKYEHIQKVKQSLGGLFKFLQIFMGVLMVVLLAATVVTGGAAAPALEAGIAAEDALGAAAEGGGAAAAAAGESGGEAAAAAVGEGGVEGAGEALTEAVDRGSEQAGTKAMEEALDKTAEKATEKGVEETGEETVKKGTLSKLVEKATGKMGGIIAGTPGLIQGIQSVKVGQLMLQLADLQKEAGKSSGDLATQTQLYKAFQTGLKQEGKVAQEKLSGAAGAMKAAFHVGDAMRQIADGLSRVTRG
ncbi:MAG: hypothetical protein S4CHLAM45_11230 [Chlamydiales bacterium]|nr:hypothetical protein [Chlamydiales bacterium]MCH9619615.1 hypothetical protein [Chlamydiales bacterium]MCH9623221.1 hypothetical protein [Chlamydiales bacterium]